MADKELFPKVEIEWEGKKYLCPLDFGWAYRLDDRFGINVLDFRGFAKGEGVGPKKTVAFLWASLVAHLPALTPEIIAANMSREDIVAAMSSYLQFITSNFFQGDPEKKAEAESH